MDHSLRSLSSLLAPAILGLLLATAPASAAVKTPVKPPEKAADDLAARTAGMVKKAGLLTFHLDAKTGKVWLEVPPADGPGGEAGTYIYVDSILTGLGSNPVGLDRGQLGDTRIVTLRRLGGRLLVEQQNLRFRALTENADELRAVRESFATSVLWGGEITAGPDGRALVDFTGFLVRDAHDIPARMRLAGQGSWSLDAARSAVDLENCLAFPDNVELEALLTYQSSDPGELVRQTAPVPGAVTLIQHHSFVRLPDAGYEPRPFDPRAGSFPVAFADYAAPLAAPVETRWIARHRLEKVDPAAARSRVKEPIVYYVDSAAPEPVRSALIEGAGWWKDAFEKAGFLDAYRVEALPPGVHPLDVRYNVIQWVHRSTRGWSYGGGIIDPRTGEILKGHVTLGSLRVRQDRLIFEGLAGTEKSGTGAPDDPVVLSLARIRQLAAHEVGHSLGLSHNFAASIYGRASVMDYPAPLVGIGPDGELDFSSAYAVGMGEWDLWSIRYAYAQYPRSEERAALQGMLDEAIRRGLLFLTDEDARPAGAANPKAVLWDNGPDPVAGLRHALEVRRIALSHFGEHNIQPGQPLALLQEVLVPLYFHHRYQLDGALKAVGGVDYTYAVRGDGQPGQTPVDGKRQREALESVLTVLDPGRLDLSESVIALLLPRPAEYRPNPELFRGNTAPVFDPLAAAASMADMAVDGLLQPERAARLVDLHRRDPQLPGLEEVLDALVETSFGGPLPNEPRRAELRRVVQWVTMRRMIGLSGDPEASPMVRARVDGALRALERRLEPASGTRSGSGPEAAQKAFLAAEIERYLSRPEGDTARRPAPPEPPPGQPIGTGPMGTAPMATPEGLSGCSQE
jgi:Met-zincin/Domain of unknown function (DUF5117)